MSTFHVQFAEIVHSAVGDGPSLSAFSAETQCDFTTQVCKQVKTPVDPATCTLNHGKTTLKLSEPIRFAGLPRGATLVMESSQPDAPRLGFLDSATAAAAAPVSEPRTLVEPTGTPMDTPEDTPSIRQSDARAQPEATAAACSDTGAQRMDMSPDAAAGGAIAPSPAPQAYVAPSRPQPDAVASHKTSYATNVAPSQQPAASPGAGGMPPASGGAVSGSQAIQAGAARAAEFRSAVPESDDVGGASKRPDAPGAAADLNHSSAAGPPAASDAGAGPSSAAEQPSAGFHSELGIRPAMSVAQLATDARARKYDVFSLAALAHEGEASAAAAEDDPPDEFYELTAADVQQELAAARRRQQYNEAGLRTKVRREREAAQKAAAIGHATIRLFLPFGVVVQAEFAPFDRLAQLHAFVRHALLTDEFAQSFHLFTTPPKTLLGSRDLEATFWDKGMVPGAHVHVGIEHQDVAGALAVQQPCQADVYKAFIRSEVLARQGPVPDKPAPSASTKRAAAADDAVSKLAGDSFKPSGSSKIASSGKVPKWLKLGK